MEKIKALIPSPWSIVKLLVGIVVINALLELIGGTPAAFVARPVATVKALAGKSAA